MAGATVAIISDTHLPRGRRALPHACVERLRAADLILHAGDFVTAAILEELAALGPPVHAVAGNNDDAELRARLPERLVLDVGEVRIGMLHDAGPAMGRLRRMRARFADCDAVVFGHSHVPLRETEVVAGVAFTLFNPGSPIDKRRQPRPTMGLARVAKADFGVAVLPL